MSMPVREPVTIAWAAEVFKVTVRQMRGYVSRHRLARGVAYVDSRHRIILERQEILDHAAAFSGGVPANPPARPAGRCASAVLEQLGEQPVRQRDVIERVSSATGYRKVTVRGAIAAMAADGRLRVLCAPGSRHPGGKYLVRGDSRVVELPSSLPARKVHELPSRTDLPPHLIDGRDAARLLGKTTSALRVYAARHALYREPGSGRHCSAYNRREIEGLLRAVPEAPADAVTTLEAAVIVGIERSAFSRLAKKEGLKRVKGSGAVSSLYSRSDIEALAARRREGLIVLPAPVSPLPVLPAPQPVTDFGGRVVITDHAGRSVDYVEAAAVSARLAVLNSDLATAAAAVTGLEAQLAQREAAVAELEARLAARSQEPAFRVAAVGMEKNGTGKVYTTLKLEGNLFREFNHGDSIAVVKKQ